jgi:prepilin-type N-terminal cleavage/methylation domain-containing protein
MKQLRSNLTEQQKRRQRGFSMVEVIIAAVIMTIGLLALLAMFATALANTQFSQEDLIARQKAREGLEAIFSARDDGSIPFAQIDNVCNIPPPPAVATGIFKCGWDNLVRLDPDTNEVLGVAPPSLLAEGTIPDYVLAPDNTGALTVHVPLTNFQRQIAFSSYITPTGPNAGTADPNLRKVTVTVRYFRNGHEVDYAVNGYISAFN